MYGYITPYKPDMSPPEKAVYTAFYCGICKTTGRLFGQAARFATNYDITFLATLMHDYVSQEVEFGRARCIGGPLFRRTYVKRNPLLERIAAANILLAYYKLEDDIIDGSGISKRLAKRALKKARKKAVKIVPNADGLIAKMYAELRELEKAGCDILDKAAHPFAELTAELAVQIITGVDAGKYFSGNDSALRTSDSALTSSPFPEFNLPDNISSNAAHTVDNFRSLCYNIGKFIYFADALDDISEDFKKKRYNPMLAAFGGFTKKQKFFEDNHESITYATAAVINRAAESFNQLYLTQSNTLLKNIVHKGLRYKIEQVLNIANNEPKEI